MYGCLVNRNSKEQQPLLLYMHIPKTAGTSLYSNISNNLINSNYMFYWQKNIDPYIKDHSLFIGGHFDANFHKRFAHRHTQYMTIIRDPIERITSLFYYVRQLKSHPYYNLFNSTSLKKLFSDNKIKKQINFNVINNWQIRVLNNHREDDLYLAIEELEKNFTIIGTTDRFDETLKLVQGQLPIHESIHSKSVNVTKDKPPISKEVIQLIHEYNKKEFALYYYANAKLDSLILESQKRV